MSITFSNYTFEGPYAISADLKNQSGTYVILGKNSNGKWNVIDVGESDTVRERIENHDRITC